MNLFTRRISLLIGVQRGDSGRIVGKRKLGVRKVRLRLSCGIQRLAPVGGKVQVAFGLLHFQ
jgi:hypothetical protein